MDKYEFNIKTEQIKKLIRKKEYVAAAKIADTMDFSKIKNNALLITIADVYEVIGEYDKARDVLGFAYEQSQLGRQIAYRLTRVSVKRGDLEEAMEYFEDFKEVAPRDASRYILEYEIAKLQEKPLEELAAILEQYLEDDMDDKWTFELAKLYHKMDNVDKCVELCDTIILWFSEGKYVDKAMELKMLHTPLTKSQQEKYDKRWEEKEADIDVDSIKVKEISVDNKYDTQNIQAEIAKSMIELFGEDKNDGTADIFKPETSKDDSDKTKVLPSKEVAREIFANFLNEGKVEEASQLETSEDVEEESDQIEGQITLDELLNGMYKEEPVEENDTEELVSEVLVSEEDVIEENIAEEVVAEEVVAEEVVVEETVVEDALTEEPVMEETLEETTVEESVIEATVEESVIEATVEESASINTEDKSDEPFVPEVKKEKKKHLNKDEELEMLLKNMDIKVPGAITAQLEIEKYIKNMKFNDEEEENEGEDMGGDMSNEVDYTNKADENESIESADKELSQTEILEELTDVAMAVGEIVDEEALSKDDSEDEEELEEEFEDDSEDEEDDVEEEDEIEEVKQKKSSKDNSASDKEKKPQVTLSPKQESTKRLIKEFLEQYSCIEGLDKQLLKILQNMLRNGMRNDYVYIMGDVRSGKTTLAMEIIKLMGRVRGEEQKKLAKVNASSITLKNVSTITGKLGDCDVVVEKATTMEPEVFMKLLDVLDEDQINRIVVFEDDRAASERYMVEQVEIFDRFENVVKLKHNKVKDWAKHAIEYAESQGYTIDEMGLLALHAKIDQIYAITVVIHKNHIEQLIDLAIKNSRKKTAGKLISAMFGKGNYKNKILSEADFIES